MATYEDSGVNIEMGDQCSRLAYNAAKATFASRKGMIGEPLVDEGGFSGALDMGDYYLVQNDDGVGSKIQIAEMISHYDTLGYDLIAMVADDAVCVGAETISVTNTLDVNKVDPAKIEPLMGGLKAAAIEQKIVVPGGEIAELGDMLNGYIWNATAVGLVKKSKMITGSDIQSGDKIIGLRSAGIRSNGFSLVRYILKEKFGDNWANEKFDDEKTWGQVTLTPSVIYSNCILDMHGRYQQPTKLNLKGVVHVTGGGIHSNLERILKRTGTKAELNNLPEAHNVMKKLMELGNVTEDEAYKTWNMGVGMMLITNDTEEALEICGQHGIEAQIIGSIV
jgi:phosphoribosylformylglycinamidine cyclo-ligase